MPRRHSARDRRRPWVTDDRPHRRWLAIEHLERRHLLAVITWDGGGEDFDWNNPANWDTDQLPGPGDDVVIDIADFDATITHADGTTEINSLDSSEGLSLTGGSLTVATTASFGAPPLTVVSELHVGSLLTFSNGGTVILEGGTVTVGDQASAPADFAIELFERFNSLFLAQRDTELDLIAQGPVPFAGGVETGEFEVDGSQIEFESGGWDLLGFLGPIGFTRDFSLSGTAFENVTTESGQFEITDDGLQLTIPLLTSMIDLLSEEPSLAINVGYQGQLVAFLPLDPVAIPDDLTQLDGEFTFLIDTEESFLNVFADVNGSIPFQLQKEASDVAALDGFLRAVISEGQIGFPGGNLIEAIENPRPFVPGDVPQENVLYVAPGGSLAGNVTVVGDVVNSSVVTPGTSAGKVVVDGDFDQTKFGTVDVEIGGTTPVSEFDRLEIAGTATLDGELRVALVDGFDVELGQQFEIMTYGELVGEFTDTAGLRLENGLFLKPVYGENSLTLVAVAPAIVVTQLSEPITSEDGLVAQFSVRLSEPPTGNVEIPLATSDVTEGTLSTERLTFNVENFGQEQIVTVTGVDDGIPDGVQLYSVILSPAISDDPAYRGLNADDLVFINVEPNSPPVLEAIDDLMADEDEFISFTAVANDPDEQQMLRFFLGEGAPEGAAIDEETGEFTWTPGEFDGGILYTITVFVQDDGDPPLSDFQTFTVDVGEVNEPPSLEEIDDVTVNEGELVSFTAVASDSDLPGQSLTFALAEGAPVGAQIDPETGDFAWTPSEADGGIEHSITVVVTDDGEPALSASETFVVTVDEVNEPPTLDPIEDVTTAEGASVSITAVASDPDSPAQSLTFSLDEGAPEGASIDPVTGAFTWTPGESDGGTTRTVTVRVTDNGDPDLSATETFAITVVEINSPPQIQPIEVGPIEEGQTLVLTVEASDPDLPVQSLRFSLGEGVPEGATIDPQSGQFSWTPGESDGGRMHPITVLVTDDGSEPQVARQTFQVFVSEVNSPPVLKPNGPISLEQGEKLSLQVEATDVDQPEQQLTFTIVSGAPEGMTIDPETGLLEWEPPDDLISTDFAVVVRVTDSGDPPLSTTETIEIAFDGVDRDVFLIRDSVFDDFLQIGGILPESPENTAVESEAFRGFLLFDSVDEEDLAFLALGRGDPLDIILSSAGGAIEDDERSTVRGQSNPFEETGGAPVVFASDDPTALTLYADDALQNFLLFEDDGPATLLLLVDAEVEDDETGSELEPGSIEGRIFNDWNRNGKFDEGDEEGIADQQVYLDLNHNGRFDEGEPEQQTDFDGRYHFTGVEMGQYDVRIAAESAWQTAIGNQAVQSVNLELSGEVAGGVDFGLTSIQEIAEAAPTSRWPLWGIILGAIGLAGIGTLFWLWRRLRRDRSEREYWQTVSAGIAAPDQSGHAETELNGGMTSAHPIQDEVHR